MSVMFPEGEDRHGESVVRQELPLVGLQDGVNIKQKGLPG